MRLNNLRHQIYVLRLSSSELSCQARSFKTQSFEPPGAIERRTRRFSTSPASRDNQVADPPAAVEINPDETSVEHFNTPQRKNYSLIGNLYEQHSLKCMQEILLMKDLVHVGKRGSQDGGIDIKGWLYSNHKTEISAEQHEGQGGDQVKQTKGVVNQKQERFIRAIAQCKCSRVELKLIRELEGLVASSSTYTNPNASRPTIGLLFAARGFTSASLTRAERSPFPLILVTLDLPSTLLLSLDDDDSARIYGNNHLCKISHCYPNPIAVQLIRPFEFIRVSKLTSDGLPAETSWILVDRTIIKP